MSSIISRVLELIFPQSEYRVMFMGLDAAGKTTILYKLKLGEIVTTIPTIGFNVETIEYKSMSLTAWDVGGCDKIRPLWRHYYQNTQALIFVIDSNDRERFLHRQEDSMKDDLYSFEGVLVNTLNEDELRDAVVLIYVNKQDLPNAMTVQEIKDKMQLEQRMRGRTYYVQPCSAVSGDGLYEGLDWLATALDNKRRGIATVSISSPEVIPSPPVVVEAAATPPPAVVEPVKSQLEEWMERIDESDDDFLRQFEDYTLDAWDHYTHLRIAYLYLTRYGRQKAIPLIFRGIEQFILHSPRTNKPQLNPDGTPKRGTTFHETMTYFWTHMVHYAMVTMKSPDVINRLQNNKTGDQPIIIGEDSDLLHRLTPFKFFLLLNPQLSNGGLFLTYYSKELMLLNAQARKEVVLPDKQPLPSIVLQGTLKSSSSLLQSTTTNTEQDHQMTLLGTSFGGVTTLLSAEQGNGTSGVCSSDMQYLALFEQKALPAWGHEMKLHVIFVYLCRDGRGKGQVDRLLSRLTDYEGGSKMSHFTINYFWIQIVTFAIMSCVQLIQKKKLSLSLAGDGKNYHFGQYSTIGNNSKEQPQQPDEALLCPFQVFYQAIQQQNLAVDLTDSLLYEQYYSRALIDSKEACEGFVLPDLKPLPNLIFVSS